MPALRSRRQAAAQELIDLLEPLTTSSDGGEAASGGDGPDTSLLAAIQNLVSVLDPVEPLYAAFHDGKMHHPLGGGSYAFQYDLAGPLLLALAHDEAAEPTAEKMAPDSTTPPESLPCADPDVQAGPAESGAARPTQATVPTRPIIIHAGAQPNNSPHLGTMIVFSYAFLIAKALRERLSAYSRDTPPPRVAVEITFVDTAPVPSSVIEFDGITYQRSYRDVPGALATYMDDYRDALGQMSQWSGVPFQTRFQSDFFSHPAVPSLVGWMVAHRDRLASQLSPKHNALALRAACPVADCGLAEKHGRLNRYVAGSIELCCPRHGRHAIRVAQASEVARLEANAPTRNLIRSMTHILDGGATTHHVRITGADYAGTLYVADSGYRAMRHLGMDGLCSYAKLRAEHGETGLRLIWAEVEAWFESPHKLFRASYSVEYFRGVLQGNNKQPAMKNGRHDQIPR
ncbi:hypothetical protein LLEC1_04652 [Akanthomyces lecanii]|uniref:Uncharacterized protein n=1 Tax=Cordyceps confragosa TaxID=2714763 RepID=A0A179IHR1_CORDF|nr:hypothetical protein LLEC1_04652 [Akanthomyces lecanii]